MVDCEKCGLCKDSSVDYKENHLCQPCTKLVKNHASVDITPLSSNDLELVLAWRSHPLIYEHFRRQNGPIEWGDHVSWFKSRESDRYDFVISFDGRRVGVINLSTTDEVGIFLGDFSAQGHGVATAALEWLCSRFADRTPLFAEVHEKNKASKRLFERCGFHLYNNDSQWSQYKYDP